MIGLGTLINVAAVVTGGLIGVCFKGKMPSRFETTLLQAMGLAVIFLGIAGTMEGMLAVCAGGLEAGGSMMLIFSLLLGAIVGEALNLEYQMERFGAWLRRRFRSERDQNFIQGFINASLTVCIGAMAVVGALEDGLTADHSTLFAKAMLDFVIVLALAASYGRGVIFSAIPLLVLQGSITLLATVLKPLCTEVVIGNMSFVGSALIFCVGVNLMFQTKIKTANLLPAILFAAAFGWLPVF